MKKTNTRTSPKARPTRRPQPPARAKKAGRPLLWQQINRWLDFGGDIHDWRKTRLDRRLFTIAPAFEGVMDGIMGYAHDVPAARQKQILSIATRALGTYDAALHYRRDSLRRRVVLDWAVRSALPQWIERLPAWTLSCLDGPTAFAQELRSHKKLLWVSEIGDVVHLLTKAWIRLEDDIKSWRTRDELALLVDVQERIGIILQMLTDTMAELFGAAHHSGNHDAWVCNRAVGAVVGRQLKSSATGAAVAAMANALAMVPSLIEVLLAVDPADSQRGAADRCAWHEPRKQTPPPSRKVA